MSNNDIKIDNLCYHCGSPCEEDKKTLENKQFCCSGCLAVHSILIQHKLGNYYDLESYPGIRTQKGTSYDFADNPEIAEQFIDFKNQELTKIKFRIPAIHCSSCIWLLENLHLLNSGVTGARVNFQEQEASISFEHKVVSLREVLELLDRIGYSPDLGLDGEENVSKKNNIRLVKQLAFAGFVFGNIMLFSFPEYFGFVSAEDHSYGQVFSYLNLILSIPLVIFSGRDYLKTAYDSIKLKTLHIYVPVSIGILALFGWSTFSVLSGEGAGYFDSLAGLIFFLLIGKWIQEFTNKKLIFNRKYESYFPLSVQVIKENGESTIPLHDIEKGDRIRVRKGELIPADGHLFKGVGQIDYSFVTGESIPEHRELGELVYAGGRQLAQAIEIEITKKVKESKLISLWNEKKVSEEKADAQGLISKTSKVFTISLLVIALITFLFWVSIDLNKAIFSTVSVLIVACPCALALAYPFATGSAKRLLAKGKYYLKNAGVIEKIANTKKVVFDKTGTLTQAMNYKPNYVGRTLTLEEKTILKSLAYSSDHPYSKSISNHWPEAKRVEVDSFNEIPGKGIEGWVKDRWVKLGSETYVFNKEHSNKKIHQVYVSMDDSFIGAFDFKSEYFSFVQPLIKDLKKSNEIHLCTGDSEREKAYLQSAYSFDSMHFNADPKNKVEFIKKLNKGDTLYLGDGLNDAGALMEANVGLAITKSLIHFTPASDVITPNEEMAKLSKVIDYSKAVMNVVRLGIVISALYNLVGLFYAVQGLLSPIIAAILMPISSITTVVLMTGLTHVYAKKKGII